MMPSDQLLSYPVFYFLAQELNERLNNAMLVDAYSVSKEQTILEFSREDQLSTSLIIYASNEKKMLWFVDEYAKPRSKYQSKFQSLIGDEAQGVKAISNERCLVIDMKKNEPIVLAFLGSKYFITKGLIEEKTLRLPGNIQLPFEFDEQLQVKEFLQKRLFGSSEAYQLWLKQPTFNLYAHPEKAVILRLIPTYNLEKIAQANSLQDILKMYAKEWFGFYGFENRYQLILKHLTKEEPKLHYAIGQAKKQLFKLQNELNYRQKADIIMANLQNLVKGMKEGLLFNFYTQEMVQIPLKEKLSPQENAERLYKKAKHQGIQEQLLQERIDTSEEQLLELLAIKEALASCTTVNELQELEKKVFPIKSKQEEQIERFHRYKYMGYDIYVGRNAKNNDELSQGFAAKNDLWLHAKDVAGSHVIIRNKGTSTTYPKAVIAYAAGLAIANSKAKQAAQHPVMYTAKKYLRKPKGAKAGAVWLERYDIIFASPIK